MIDTAIVGRPDDRVGKTLCTFATRKTIAEGGAEEIIALRRGQMARLELLRRFLSADMADCFCLGPTAPGDRPCRPSALAAGERAC